MSTLVTVLWLLGIAFLAILWVGFLASLFQMMYGLARRWLRRGPRPARGLALDARGTAGRWLAPPAAWSWSPLAAARRVDLEA